jgi:hypothetical protein
MKRTCRDLFLLIVLHFSVSAVAQKGTVLEKNGLKLYEMEDSPDYPNAELVLDSPPKGWRMLPVGEDTFYFKVKNFDLGAQTPDAEHKMCANSAKGQHIHFIMNNSPYLASYDSNIVYPISMDTGSYVMLAFLSRSYHESLKKPQAYVLREFNVGANMRDEFDENAPHIFFSRPKGDYVGPAETNRVMLDFYLVNCTLSPEGYKVKATINGNEFLLTNWAPYMIEGLPLGQNKITLELLDKDEKPVKSPYNGTTRTITLKG